MSIILLGAALMLQGQAAPGPLWRPLAFMNKGTPREHLLYINSDVKRLSDSAREMTLAYAFAQKQKMPAGDVAWMEVTYKLDCTAKTAQPVKAVTKDERRSDPPDTSPAPAISFNASFEMARATSAACSGDFASFNQRSYEVFHKSASLFPHLRRLEASDKSTGWWRTAVSGKPGDRFAIFVDRTSITTGPASYWKNAVILSVSEGAGGSVEWFRSTLAVNCATGMYSEVLSDLLTSRGFATVFANDSNKPLDPKSIMGSLRAPICSGDFSKGRAFAADWLQVPNTAFAP